MVGDSETEVFWTQFLRHLRERGLGGVRLVLGDHHSGLVKAIRKVMIGAAYQRCRVHFLRNVFGVIPKDAAEMVAATIRTIFAQPDQDAVRNQLDTVADMLGAQFPRSSRCSWTPGRPHRLRGLPGTALEEDSVHEPAGADQPRDQTPRRCRPGLPQRRRSPPTGHRRALRDARRVDRLPPPLPTRRQHGPDLPHRSRRKRPRTPQHHQHDRRLIAYTTSRDTTHFRKQAGLTQEQFAEMANIHVDTVGSIEQGRLALQPDRAAQFDELLGTGGVLSVLVAKLPVRERIVQFAQGLVDHEQEAVSLLSYEAQVVPGLLQTRDCCRAASTPGIRRSGVRRPSSG